MMTVCRRVPETEAGWVSTDCDQDHGRRETESSHPELRAGTEPRRKAGEEPTRPAWLCPETASAGHLGKG